MTICESLSFIFSILPCTQLLTILLFHSYNTHRSSSTLAPMKLCSIIGFDLKNIEDLCPSERNALRDFYYSAKGGEWTEDDKWIDDYSSFCDWHGVKCDEANRTVVDLNLTNNGLSGTMSPSIGSLTSLTILDLSDNDIKVRYILAIRILHFCVLNRSASL